MARDRLKARIKGGAVEVKAIIAHPMESGRRRNKETGELIPAHFIQEVICQHNGNTVMSMQWGGSVSTNPYLSFRFKGGKKGDAIAIKWSDIKGNTGELSGKVS